MEVLRNSDNFSESVRFLHNFKGVYVLKKWLSILVVLTIGAALLTAGCGGGGEEVVTEETVIRYNVGTEPQTLDPALMTGIPESTMLLQMYDGLTRLDADNNPQAAIAESWDISEDGTEFTFHLREDAVWTNGDPLTAADFEFSWKRALDPAMAGDYAYMFYLIEGAEAYNAGEGSADAVAITAVDDYTLKVKLVSGAPYFISLTAFPTYYPLHRATVEADNEGWALSVDTMITNGPYKMVKWAEGQIEYVPNESYWDAGAIKLDRLVFTMVEEQSTELTMFETGEIDMTNTVPGPEIPRLKAERPDELHIFPYLGTYYYIFNCEQAPFDDVNVRKALTMAIDRVAIVETVTQGGQLPAFAFVPFGVADLAEGSDFREAGGDYYTDDVTEAKRLLAEAGYPDGVGFPPFEILHNTSEMHKMIAEAIQEMWTVNLGITGVTITNQEWGVYLDSRDEGAFDVARAGWIGDYVEANTFLDMWKTGGGNNNAFWGDARYDQIIADLLLISDPAERIPLLHEQEDILMEAMPIMPIYYYTLPAMVSTRIDGYVQLTIGGVDFKNAYVVE